jgi:hypothetical protein
MRRSESPTAVRPCHRPVGVGGTVNGYGMLVLGDTIVVERDGAEVARSTVDGLGRFVAAARDLKLGWGRFPDDAEVIFLYDRADNWFGYAVNLDWTDGSEWGHAPFGEATTTGAHPRSRRRNR